MKTGKVAVVLLLVGVLGLIGCERHEHTYEAVITEEALCMKDGIMTYTCPCGEMYTEVIVSSGNHVWGQNEVLKEAACAEDGICVYQCTLCGEHMEESIPAHGQHTWGEAQVIQEANCITEGSSVSVCSVCDLSLNSPIPVLDTHEWDDGQIAEAADCQTEGEYVYTCMICGDTRLELIPKTEIHIWTDTKTIKEASCDADGIAEYTCSVCQIAKTEIIPATDQHIWDNGKVTKNATCAENGIILYTCSVCDKQKNTDIARTRTHQWDAGKVTKKAVCGTDGVKTYICKICGSTASEAIPTARTHNWTNHITTESTADRAGVMTYTCRNCDTSYTEQIRSFNEKKEYTTDPYHIINSYNPNNYMEFTIDGNTLKVEGRIIYDGLEKIWVRCGDITTTNEYSKILNVSSGQKFTIDLSLTPIKTDTYVEVYVKPTDNNGMFNGYIWNEVKIVPNNNGYQFASTLVLQHNVDMMQPYINPQDCMTETVSAQMKALSDTIVGEETDPYRKLWLLNKWVAENIYYDFDYFYNRSSTAYLTADEVYQARRSVCAGYAQLLNVLVQAQGIPSIKVSTYSTGNGTAGYFNESNMGVTEANHAHIEAYLASEDRWVIMDPTWDSGNRYENGSFQAGEFRNKYFDITLPFLSYSHKIIKRPS